MAPNATLAAILDACERLCLHDDPLVDDLVREVGALDEWLSKGGFLPDAWAKGR